MSRESNHPLRLLSIGALSFPCFYSSLIVANDLADGGGVRGLSSLVILKHLMYQVDPSEETPPYKYFDMIAGTSTGG